MGRYLEKRHTIAEHIAGLHEGSPLSYVRIFEVSRFAHSNSGSFVNRLQCHFKQAHFANGRGDNEITEKTIATLLIVYSYWLTPFRLIAAEVGDRAMQYTCHHEKPLRIIALTMQSSRLFPPSPALLLVNIGL